MTGTLAGLWRVDWLIQIWVSSSRVQAQHLRCGPLDYCSSPTHFRSKDILSTRAKYSKHSESPGYAESHGGQTINLCFSKNNLKIPTVIMTKLIICKWDCYEKTNRIMEFLFPASINIKRHDKGDLTKEDPATSQSLWVILYFGPKSHSFCWHPLR